MADFPASAVNRLTISPWSQEAIGVTGRLIGMSAAPSSATWPFANRAIFVPFVLAAPFAVTKVWWANGATASANIDCGLYTIGGTLLGSIGSTVQAGTSVVQSAALSLLLQPGSYYMALALSATTGTVLRSAGLTASLGAPIVGQAQQISAFPLPATATFGSINTAFLPLFGITSASVI